MSEHHPLHQLAGPWSGPSKLWLTPMESPRQCDSTAQVLLVAQGQFMHFAYTWEYESEPQDGLIIVALASGNTPKKSVWFDSWHMRNAVMVCDAATDDFGVTSMLGSYPAPPGPDWRWRIEFEVRNNDSFDLRMFNITPAGEEALAVQTGYARRH